MSTPTFPSPAPEAPAAAVAPTAQVLAFDAEARRRAPGDAATARAPCAWNDAASGRAVECPVPRPRTRECAAVATQNATLVLDDSGHVRWCSPAARQVFGYDAQRLLGTPIRSLLPQLPLNARTPGYNAAFVAFSFPGDALRALWGIDSDGRRFAVDVSMGIVRTDLRPTFVVTLRRHCAPESAALDLSRFLEAAETRADAIAVTDAEGTIVHVNRAFETLTGYPRAEVGGRRIDLLAVAEPGPDRFARARERLRSSQESRETFLAVGRGDRRFHVEETLRPFVDAQGRVTHYVSTLRDVSERVEAVRRLDHLAHHDSLTGLPNRALFGDRLRQEIARSARDGAGFALLALDLDAFKGINDRLGHEAGDEVLRTLAQRLRQVLREGDTVARLGGDEFAIILPGARSRSDVAAVLDAMRGALAVEVAIAGGAALRIAVSIGVARFPNDGEDERSLLRAADRAMYRAKRAANSRDCFADDPPQDEAAIAGLA